VSLLAVTGALPPALLGAWVLARLRFPGRGLLALALSLPLVLPPVVTGWLLLVVLGRNGPVGALLNRWLGIRLPFTTAGAAVACGTMVFPLLVRAARIAFEAADPGLEAAARSLGAGRLDRLLTVTLPLAIPGVVAGIALAYATSLGEFGAVITFAASIPGQTQTLPLAIFNALQSPGGEAQAARLAVASLVLAMLGLGAAEAVGRRLNLMIGR
jgi:molybdate transport system permease protein